MRSGDILDTYIVPNQNMPNDFFTLTLYNTFKSVRIDILRLIKLEFDHSEIEEHIK